MFCTQCGSQLKESQKFCTKCGAIANIEKATTPPSPKPTPVAMQTSGPTTPPRVAQEISPAISPQPPLQSPVKPIPRVTPEVRLQPAPRLGPRTVAAAIPATPRLHPSRSPQITAPKPQRHGTTWLWIPVVIIIAGAGVYFGVRAFHHGTTENQPTAVTTSTKTTTQPQTNGSPGSDEPSKGDADSKVENPSNDHGSSPHPKPRKENKEPNWGFKKEVPTETVALPPTVPQTQPNPTPPPTTPPTPQPRIVTLPAGTTFSVRLINSVDTTTHRAGELFRALVDVPVALGETVVVPKGTEAYVKLVNASSAGHSAGKSELTLELTSFVLQGHLYYLSGSELAQPPSSRGKAISSDTRLDFTLPQPLNINY